MKLSDSSSENIAQYSAESHQRCFPFLDAKEAAQVFGYLTRRSFLAQDVVMHPGEEARHCLFVLRGKLAVQKYTDFAERMQVVGLLDSGSPVGEAGLLDGRQRSSMVIAVENTEVLQLTLDGFQNLREHYPDVAIKILMWLLDKVSLRLQKNSERLAKVL